MFRRGGRVAALLSLTGCNAILGIGNPDIVGALPDGAASPEASVRDASHDHAAPRDATHDAPGDGGTPDATGSPDGGGYCATYDKPDGAIQFLCFDFDESPDASALGTPFVGGGSGTVVMTSEAFSKSAPRSLEFTASPPTGGSTYAAFHEPVSSGASYVVACDVLLEKLPFNTGFNHLFALKFNSNGTVVIVTMTPAADGGVSAMGLNLTGATSDAGGQLSGPVQVSGWAHIELTVTATEATLVVNDAGAAANLGLPAGFVGEEPQLQLGLTYETVPVLRQAFFDNVTVTVR